MSRKYTVRAGDTLEKIATVQLGDKSLVQQLANINNIRNPNRISVGQTLYLPHCVYNVQRGDTLIGISRVVLKNARDWEKLAELNNISPPYAITPGQTLYIPIAMASEDAVLEDREQVIAEKGDSANSIAAQLDADPATVAKENQISRTESLDKGRVVNAAPKKPTFREKNLQKFPTFAADLEKELPSFFPSSKSHRDATGEQRLNIAIGVYVDLLLNYNWIEGLYSYMYADSRYLVTVGIGMNVDDVDVLKKLLEKYTFYISDASANSGGVIPVAPKATAATTQQVLAAHRWVKERALGEQKKKTVPNPLKYYDPTHNNVILKKDDMIAIAKAHVSDDVTRIITSYFAKDKKFKCNGKEITIENGYESYPIPALVGLIDMIYNMGGAKLLGLKVGTTQYAGFPRFLRAVSKLDWVQAAVQSHRDESPGEGVIKRNIMTYDLYLLAGKGEPK